MVCGCFSGLLQALTGKTNATAAPLESKLVEGQSSEQTAPASHAVVSGGSEVGSYDSLEHALSDAEDDNTPADDIEIFQLSVQVGPGKSFTLNVTAGDTIANVKGQIQVKEGSPPAWQRLIYSGKQLEDGRTLASYGIARGKDMPIVHLTVGRLPGGGKRLPVIRRDKHVTKGDMLKMMIKKTQQAVADQMGIAMDEDVPDAPQSLAAFLRPFQQRLDERREVLTSGEPVIRPALETVSDQHLDKLETIMGQRSGIHPEERVLMMANVLLGDLGTLDLVEKHVQLTKQKIIDLFIEAYGREYHSERSGSVRYDNDRLMEHIREIKAYRKGLRRAAGDNGEGVQPAVIQQDGNCNIA